MNIVGLIGRFARDPELRYTDTGKAVCSFTLAVRNPFTPDNADFISCVAWEARAELLAELKTGTQIGVAGRISTRNYENNEGKRVYVTEVNVSDITFVEKKEPEQQQQQRQEPAKNNSRSQGNSGGNNNRSNSNTNRNNSGSNQSNSRQSPRQ